MAAPGDINSLRIMSLLLEMLKQIEQFGHSYVAAQVCARSVELLMLVSLLLLVNHFFIRSFLGLTKPFWVAGFSICSKV